MRGEPITIEYLVLDTTEFVTVTMVIPFLFLQSNGIYLLGLLILPQESSSSDEVSTIEHLQVGWEHIIIIYVTQRL